MSKTQQGRDISGMDELDQAVSTLQKAEDARAGANGDLVSPEDLENAIKSERHAMLVINELCSRMVPFEPGRDYDKDIDLMEVAVSLGEAGLSVKQCQKLVPVCTRRRDPGSSTSSIRSWAAASASG